MNSNFNEVEKLAVREEEMVKEGTDKPVKKETKKVKKNIYQKLFAVQQSLKAHKGQHNDYGNYNYRSAEDILEAVKPHLKEQEALILIKDEIFNLGGQVNRLEKEGYIKEMPNNYIKAIVRFVDIDTGEEVTAEAYARECEHTGMSADQCTGCASSYARKYALNALLSIDNTADSDSNAVAEIERKAKASASEGKTNEGKTINSKRTTPASWGEKAWSK